MSDKLKLTGKSPMGNINLYKIDSEWKGTIDIDYPVKAKIEIWGKTQDDCKGKINLFLSRFTFLKPKED